MRYAKLVLLLKFISTSVLPCIFWCLLMFGFDEPYLAIFAILSSLIHELGHCIPIVMYSKNGEIATRSLRGFRIFEKEYYSYREIILITLCGPLANILTAIFIFLLPFANDYLKAFAIVNMINALSNLLPVEYYDGFNILKSLFEKNNHTKHTVHLYQLSFAITIVMVFLSLYAIYRFDGGYWIFAVFFISMIRKLLTVKKLSILEK